MDGEHVVDENVTFLLFLHLLAIYAEPVRFAISFQRSGKER